MISLEDKYNLLKSILNGYGKVCVAYSGGVDSTFLLDAANETLGGCCMGITIYSEVIPKRELLNAVEWTERRGIKHRVLSVSVLEIESFSINPPERCYSCKKEVFGNIIKSAALEGFDIVADGTNADDISDYRPGLQALKELGIKSPLLEAGLGKEEIRSLSRERGLDNWNAPAAACLASRIPYGAPITGEKLVQIEEAEALLFDLGFRGFRVRHHGDIARLELRAEELQWAADKYREVIAGKFKELGFRYVTVDLEGFRSGSLNPIKKS